MTDTKDMSHRQYALHMRRKRGDVPGILSADEANAQIQRLIEEQAQCRMCSGGGDIECPGCANCCDDENPVDYCNVPCPTCGGTGKHAAIHSR
jgi:hypothetical protein